MNCHKDIMKRVTNIYQKLYQLVRYMSQRQYKLCNKDFPKNTMQFLVVTKIQLDMSQVYSNITSAWDFFVTKTICYVSQRFSRATLAVLSGHKDTTSICHIYCLISQCVWVWVHTWNVTNNNIYLSQRNFISNCSQFWSCHKYFVLHVTKSSPCVHRKKNGCHKDSMLYVQMSKKMAKSRNLDLTCDSLWHPCDNFGISATKSQSLWQSPTRFFLPGLHQLESKF